MKSYIESLRIYQELLWTDRADITATLHNIGNLCYSNSNYNNAMVYYLEAMRLTRLHFRQDSISMANTLNNVAWVLFMMRFHDEALKSALGDEFSAAYIKLKLDDWNKYSRHLTQWELETTLDC